MGSLVKCAACGERSGTRPIGVYWRWQRSDTAWKHYYARLCPTCWAAKVVPLDVDYTGATELTCPACHIGTEGDYDAIYTTSFPGGGPQLETESPFCGACAAEYRTYVLGFARDTDDNVGAPGPQRKDVTPAQVMRSLGRE